LLNPTNFRITEKIIRKRITSSEQKKADKALSD